MSTPSCFDGHLKMPVGRNIRLPSKVGVSYPIGHWAARRDKEMVKVAVLEVDRPVGAFFAT